MVDDSQSKKYVIIIAICSNCNTQSKLEKKTKKKCKMHRQAVRQTLTNHNLFCETELVLYCESYFQMHKVLER